MKRFFVSILCVSVFFIGLGAVAGKVAAKFKSDDKAVEIIKQARIAIGGDASIAQVRSMTISGKMAKTISIGGEERTEQGETEIALQLPDKLMKMVKLGDGDEGLGKEIMMKHHDVMVVRSGKDGEGVGVGTGEGTGVRKVIIKRDDGTTEEVNGPESRKIITTKAGEGDNVMWKTDGGGEKHMVLEREHRAAHEGMRQNELFRLTLGLLLSSPEGLDVSYTFAGEGDVDGTTCNIINADVAGSSVRLYISKASSLPVMMAYKGHELPHIFNFQVDSPKEGGEPAKDVIFVRKGELPSPEEAEFQVRFADYRGVNGVQLPYRWTTTMNGKMDEVFDVTAYELNPSNIAEKFANQKVMIRTSKPQ
ncbi:MAG TPA: hypothetical protein VGQ55_11895 [Pyrinomonadaceae bacterium]|jgi:hypothetical protein|nr:hypothetical protein [Pyrinomonadaceae bacterium]